VDPNLCLEGHHNGLLDLGAAVQIVLDRAHSSRAHQVVDADVSLAFSVTTYIHQ
jgi:hypothetical protein